jgi:hypothetical protein
VPHIGPEQFKINNRLQTLKIIALTNERLLPSHSWRHRFKTLGRQFNLDTSNNSPIWFVSDFIGMDESEMIPCEISRGFSMSMIA